MFGIGSTELLVILVVALVVLGPKSLPGIAKTVGKVMGEFRRVTTDLQRTMNAEMAQEEHDKLKKEAEKELFGHGEEAEKKAKESSVARDTTKEQSVTESDGIASHTSVETEQATVTIDASTAKTPPSSSENPLEQAVAKAQEEARQTTEATQTASSEAPRVSTAKEMA